MIRFACPGCSASFTVPDEKAGKSGKCPKCQSQFVIPAAAGGSAPSKPAPAPAPAADQPVEIQPCPKCGERLSVMAGDLGLDIECTNCQTVFKAVKVGSAPKPQSKPPRPSTVEDDEDDRPKSKGKSSRRDDDDRPKSKSRRDEDDEDDRPKSKRGSRRGDDDEDEDDRPKSKGKSSRRGEEDDEDDRPSKRGSRRGDDEDDDRPSRRSPKKRKGGGGSMESKKTTAGLLGLFLGSLGVHKFYLGYSAAGAIQIVLTLITCGLAGWIGIIEGIIYLTKSDEDFIETYQRNEKQWF